MVEPITNDIPGEPLPTAGRIAGIDFGTVRIGIAICDPGQSIASPLETYTRRTLALDQQRFESLVTSEAVVGFVIGLPVHMSGDASEKSEEAVAFGTWLGGFTSLPIDYIDERYTTAMARELLNQTGLSGKKRKAQLDKLAAQIILSAWLERREGSLEGRRSI